METYGTIYKIINDIDNEIYIGETTRNIEERWTEHCFDERSSSKIHKKIQTYGWQHFQILEIEKVPLSCIYERKNYWKKYYNVNDNENIAYILTGHNILVIEPNIIFNNIDDMYHEISELTSWSSAFCKKNIQVALTEHKKFLDYTLQSITVSAEQISSIEDRENWIKSLNVRYCGKHLYCKELDIEFETQNDAARYLIENKFYITSNKYPVQSLITLIRKHLNGKIEGINTINGIITFEQLPGLMKEPSDKICNKIVKVRCLELNKDFNSQNEAARYMINKKYWTKIKIKTAQKRINDVIYNIVPNYKGYTFIQI